ncbi:MAG: tetratricopeptide repeat protein [Actinobacteria bacterium]|nr:tetratricopeptide repeat protein [Actinomycetota bacterium]
MTLPANFGRAVDLSGLGKPAPAKSTVSVGIEVTAANLTSEILPLSRTKLVVLFCWSNRSPESIAILDILAKLQSGESDRWSLGTVNVDVETQVAQALQVRTVPYALALIAEQVVPLFEQSYPEAQIRQVIDKVLSIAAEQGIGSVPEEIVEPEEEEALAALEVGDFLAAEVAYKKWLARKPQEIFAKLGLAQTQLLIRTTALDAEQIFVAAEVSPNDVALQIQCADCEIISGKVESAFSRLLRCVGALSGDDQNLAKNHLLELFTLVDPGDPRLIKARGALANALF